VNGMRGICTTALLQYPDSYWSSALTRAGQTPRSGAVMLRPDGPAMTASPAATRRNRPPSIAARGGLSPQASGIRATPVTPWMRQAQGRAVTRQRYRFAYKTLCGILQEIFKICVDKIKVYSIKCTLKEEALWRLRLNS
jgi:hypothetical protein